MVKRNEGVRIPHKAVVFIKAEIMEVNNVGQVTNSPKAKEKRIITFDGDTFEEVREKLNKFMETCKNG
jgi:hypothetical protein